MGIGLEQRCRGSRQSGGQDHRARDVSPSSQDDIRVSAARILSAAAGDWTAVASERTSATPARRGKPVLRKASNS